MNALRWLPVALLAAFLAVVGYLLLWTTLMAYDDTGYVLYSINTYIAIGGLYDEVYTQYGPFFYVWHDVLHTLTGITFDQLTARGLTLVHWLIAAGACCLLVARLTGSPVAAAATLSAVFLHLWPMASEPAHPGGLITATIAVVAWIGVHPRFPAYARATLVGATGAALVLTKINVGVFFLAGAGAWWLLSSEASERLPRLRWALGLALAAIPPLVMHGLLGTGWVQTFALVTGLAAFGVTLATPVRHEARVPLPTLYAWVAAGALVTVVTLLTVRFSGTTWLQLWEGIVLGPLRHPLAYSAAVNWRPGAAALAIASFAALLWAIRASAEQRRRLVLGMRFLGASVGLLSLLNRPELNSLAFAMSYAASFAAWFVIPLRDHDETAGTRAWLGLLFALQMLHAFPVAGSQISWGTFLWAPLAVLGVHDALNSLSASRDVRRFASWRRTTGVLAAGLCLVATFQFARIGWIRFEDSNEVGLPGVESVRVPERHASALRVIATNAAAHADVLFTLPGMLSFHTWTGVPPPTTHNATHWFTLLDQDTQEAIRLRLESSPRTCVIVQRSVYDHLLQTNVATESPLTRWLHAHFAPAFSVETYEFWVRKDRPIAVLGTARLLETATGESPRYKVDFVVASPDFRAIQSIVMAQLEGDGSRELVVWNQDNARIVLTPLASTGAALGPAVAAAWPFDATSLLKVELLTDRMPDTIRPGSTILYFRDRDGRHVGEARVID